MKGEKIEIEGGSEEERWRKRESKKMEEGRKRIEGGSNQGWEDNEGRRR